MVTKCNICGNSCDFIFNKRVLNKYDVRYFKCTYCKHIQTETPYWLDEAYNNAISSLDVGYVRRNLYFSEKVRLIINSYFNKNKRFVDYGGGYGLFVRMMRDNGFDYYRQDKYSQNLFAVHFDLQEMDNKQVDRFELLTTFEVFEHLFNPIEEISKMFTLSDSILFSTELIPSDDVFKIENWWYFVPETGQHISFYSKETLNFISNYFNCYFYTDGKSIHLLSKKKFKTNPLKRRFKYFSWIRGGEKYSFNKNSLISNDFIFVKSLINKK